MLRNHAFKLAAVVVTASGACTSQQKTKCSGDNAELHKNGIEGCVGNTPLVYIKSLSEETKCHIYAKAEYQNPGGSIKDRTALGIIIEAERMNKLKKGGTIVEGTGGNTGIALAQIGAAKGYKVILCMPNSIAQEKIAYSQRFGAEIHLQPLVPFTNPDNYARKAEQIAASIPGSVHADQFENLANYRIHYSTTGPEIFRQTNGTVDAFVASCGTGGTLAGISSFLKQAKPGVKCFLIDPMGSVLFEYVSSGKVSATGSSEIEGIGIGRITDNFKHAELDGAFRGTDQEAVNMAYFLMKEEGLFIGPSAALNMVGAVKVAQKLGPGHTIVTIMCDGGERYLSKLYNEAWLAKLGLTPKHTDDLNSIQYSPILIKAGDNQ